MDSSRLLMKCGLPCQGEPEHLCWCSVSNLIAVACTSSTTHSQPVCVLDPDSPEEHVVLEVPLAGRHEKIISLMWTATECPRLLLAATNKGLCYAWRQSNCANALAVNVWYGEEVVSLGEDVVCAKWLSPPPCWVRRPSEGAHNFLREGGWRAHPSTSLNGQYFEGMNIVNGNIPWLRPGKLFIGLVTVDGQFMVYWKTFGSQGSGGWVKLLSLDVRTDGDIQYADIVGVGGCVRLATISKQQSERLIMFDTEGDPMMTQAINMKAIGEVVCAEGFFFESATFDSTYGGRIIYTSAKSTDLSKLLFSKYCQEQEYLSWAEFGSSTGTGSSQQMHYLLPSPDGTLVAAIAPGDPVSFLTTEGLSLTESLKPTDRPGHAFCAAFGPTGSALVVGSANNGLRARLEFWLVGFPSSGGSWAAVNADNIMWGFLARRQVWDTLQRVQLEDILDGSPRRQAAVLRILDDVIHSQPCHPRPAYARMLDNVKARILASSSDKIAKAVLIDIYSRSIIIFIYNTISHRYLSDEDMGSPDAPNGDLAQWLSWFWWLYKFRLFCCQCFKTWMGRSRMADAGTSSEELPSHVPFIRLLLDSYFTQRLLWLVMTLPCLLKHHLKKESQADLVAFHGMLMKLHQLTKIGQKSPHEDLSATQAIVDGAKTLMGGMFHIHFYRPEGTLKWQDLRKIETMSTLSNLVDLTDDEIETGACELGLLPVSQPPQYTAPIEDLRRGYSEFRKFDSDLDPQVTDIDNSLTLKRKQWQINRDISIGLMPLSNLASLERHKGDCLSGSALPRNKVPLHSTVDGSCITNQFLSIMGKDSSNGLSGMSRACMVASPITGTRWKLMRHM